MIPPLSQPPFRPESGDPSGGDRALFTQAPDAQLILDVGSGEVLAANARACELFGFHHDEFLGQTWQDANTAGLPNYVLGATAGGPCGRAIASHRRRDGSVVQVEVSASLVEFAGGRAALAAYRDVTDRAIAEERLRQAAKMEAIGQLAGGVAHDFNNLLTVINGYADMLVSALPADSPAVGPAAEVLAAGERAAELTRQLLAFSRKQVLRPRPLRLADLIANLRKLLCRLIGEDIRFVTAVDPNLAVVRADPGQLEQVVINLAVNARDAMPGGGTLTLDCRNWQADDGSRYVRLSVSDTGCGMTDEVKARIFEPFFTTKGPGKGTGLGLATVFGIVQQSGGRIAAESSVGVGTTFRVDLPITDAVIESGPAGARRVGSPSRGSETILLVEDEGAVRMMALHALQSRGYAVLDAEDGEQALRIVQTFGIPIRLLVTDVVMPGVGGRELADRLRTIHPNIRVLYTSGYTPDEVLERGVEAASGHFLPKPFTPQVLAQRVREILDGAA